MNRVDPKADGLIGVQRRLKGLQFKVLKTENYWRESVWQSADSLPPVPVPVESAPGTEYNVTSGLLSGYMARSAWIIINLVDSLWN